MCSQSVWGQMVSSLLAPPDWKVVRFNPQNTPLEPNRWIRIRWRSCRQTPGEVPLFILGDVEVLIPPGPVCPPGKERCLLPDHMAACAHTTSCCSPLFPLTTSLAWIFITAWTAVVWLLKESGFKVLEQERLHSGRVNISWGTRPFGQCCVWETVH